LHYKTGVVKMFSHTEKTGLSNFILLCKCWNNAWERELVEGRYVSGQKQTTATWCRPLDIAVVMFCVLFISSMPCIPYRYLTNVYLRSFDLCIDTLLPHKSYSRYYTPAVYHSF
jgi:hypothetical protein